MVICFSSYFFNVVGGRFVAFFFWLLKKIEQSTVQQKASTLLLPGLILHGPAFQEAARPALWAGERPAPGGGVCPALGVGKPGACMQTIAAAPKPPRWCWGGSGSPPGYRTARRSRPGRLPWVW